MKDRFKVSSFLKDFPEKFWKYGYLHYICGENKSGKSQLLCNICVDVASQGAKCCYVAMDDKPYVIMQKMLDIRSLDKLNNLTNVSVVNGSDYKSFDSLIGFINQYQEMKGVKFDFVFIDGLSYFYSVSSETFNIGNLKVDVKYNKTLKDIADVAQENDWILFGTMGTNLKNEDKLAVRYPKDNHILTIGIEKEIQNNSNFRVWVSTDYDKVLDKDVYINLKMDGNCKFSS